MTETRECTRARALVLIWGVAAAAASIDSLSAQTPRLETVADSLAHAVIGAHLTPGISIAVGRGQEVIFARGYGQADVEMDVATDAGTTFNIASVTKQFTAAAVMRLVEDGRISLDDPITDFLPTYPTQGHHVTVRHLLNHTSGIRSFTEVNLDEHAKREFRLDLTYEEMVDLFGRKPFDFEPGEKYHYNNSGYYLLGEIIGRVTGKPYPEYVERELLQPLGLGGLLFCPHRRVVPNRAEGYAYDDEWVNAPYLSLATFTPATGGLCSTARDLVRWSVLLHGGKVVSRASLDQMTARTALAGGGTADYGFGLHVDELGGHRKFWHGGTMPGTSAYLSHYPDAGLTIAVLANSAELREKTAEIERMLARLLLGIEGGPVTAEDIERYRGTYVLRLGSRTLDVRVFAEGGWLYAHAAGQPPLRLFFQGEHAFVAERDEGIRFVFTVKDGRAVGITLHQGGRTFEGSREPARAT